MAVDYIFNGQAFGDVADRLLASDMNPAVLRPWRSSNGRNYISLPGQDGKPKHLITNAPATLSPDGWKMFDGAVERAARDELRVWADLQGAGLTRDIPNGMAVTVLVEQWMTDAGAATMSMDALKRSDRDRPEMDFRNFPLPIVHGEFSFGLRELNVARRSGLPLDTTMAEMVTRRMMEQVEALTLGTAPSYSYGGGTVYGLMNKPQRITKSFTIPTDPGWTGALFVEEMLEAISDLQAIKFNGPYGMYYSPNWTRFLDADYDATNRNRSLANRLTEFTDIRFRRKLTYGFGGYQILLFQLTPDVIRAITGLPVTTLQWDSQGGLAKNFKIMAIMVPQVRHNQKNETGILHGVAA